LNFFLFSLFSEAFRLLPPGFDFYVRQRLPYKETTNKKFGRNFIVAVWSVSEIWTIENRESYRKIAFK